MEEELSPGREGDARDLEVEGEDAGCVLGDHADLRGRGGEGGVEVGESVWDSRGLGSDAASGRWAAGGLRGRCVSWERGQAGLGVEAARLAGWLQVEEEFLGGQRGGGGGGPRRRDGGRHGHAAGHAAQGARLRMWRRAFE